jgi:hypothetical protein
MPSYNRNLGGPRGFVATLTPEGQIKKVVADMNNLKDGHDLHNWSISARKELTPALTIALQVGADETARVYVPKLALVATSPVVREYLQKNPTATTAKFVHPDISGEAVQAIVQWLREISYKAEFPELPMPDDVKEFMNLRLTAYTLGMELYTKHFDYYYANDVECRAPDLEEITTIVDHHHRRSHARWQGCAPRSSCEPAELLVSLPQGLRRTRVCIRQSAQGGEV